MTPESDLTVLGAVRSSKPLTETRSVLVAVSGGADSTALLCGAVEVLSEREVRVEAAHLDHALREESRDDLRFVENLCRSLGVVLHHRRTAVGDVAGRTGDNLEATARKVRYDFLVETARSRGLSAVLTGHTADDTVETMIMNFLRGSGSRGLSGIPEVSERDGISIIRPLVKVRREAIVEYLKDKGIDWREDRTNKDTAFLRNWVRHSILPLIEERLPSVRSVLTRVSSLFESDETLLDSLAFEALRDAGIDPKGNSLEIFVKLILESPKAVAFRIIRLGLESAGRPVRSFEAVDAVWRKLREDGTSWSLDLPGGTRVRREYEVVCFGDEPETDVFGPITLPMEGEVVVRETGDRITTRVCDVDRAGPFLDADPMESFFDADKILGRLTVRNRRPGDRIETLGASGSRKVKDILIDAKVPRSRRGRVLIVCSDDEPIWVVGRRMDRRFRVTDETTKVLHIVVVPETMK